MTDQPSNGYTVLAPGFAKWWGSDARALAQAFRRLGHSILDIDEEDYVPWRWQSARSKVLRRLFSRVWIDDYNKSVLNLGAAAAYDFVLAFKGNFLKPETVRHLREFEKPIFNFYPDTTFQNYGPFIPGALRYYDCVFTTKSYHGEKEQAEFGIRDLRHVRHGFDPEVHRPMRLSREQRTRYECDVSFVGCWSPENEASILHILMRSRGLSVRVFGPGWNYASEDFKKRMGSNLRAGAFGDELAIIYCASRINLGLLRRAVGNASVFDQTTARTFQIPATRSFMLHEDTPEVRTFFRDGIEVMLFSGNDHLVEKIQSALQSPSLRDAVREKGYERCLGEPYDYSSAAVEVVSHYEAIIGLHDSQPA
jgi:spore maturation protein CgeB